MESKTTPISANRVGYRCLLFSPSPALANFPGPSPSNDTSEGPPLWISQSWHATVRLVLRLHEECQEDCVDMSRPQRCPATDRRDTKGELAGRSRAVFFWKRQEIKGVGGTGPKGSVFYWERNVELVWKKHPRGGDKVLTHWNVGPWSVTYLWIL